MADEIRIPPECRVDGTRVIVYDAVTGDPIAIGALQNGRVQFSFPLPAGRRFRVEFEPPDADEATGATRDG
jgi:hypothetical protein